MRTTFWNVHAGNLPSSPLNSGPNGFDAGPMLNFIGVSFNQNNQAIKQIANPAIPVALNWHMEPVPAGQRLEPAELYSSMLGLRLERQAADMQPKAPPGIHA